jgi:hypothetical protein
MSDAPIQSMWVGGALSTMARLSAASFIAHGHQFHLYTYHGISNPPGGVQVMDAREILPADRIIRQQHGFGRGSYAPFADVFRYELLWQRGGWWSDLDMVCLRPWDLREARVVASYWERGDVTAPINCVIKLPPQDPIMRYCLDACAKVDLASAAYGDIGPALISKAVRAVGAEEVVVPWPAFCPVGFREADAFVRGPARLGLIRIIQRLRGRPDVAIGPEAYGVHLWHEMWRHHGHSVDARHHTASWYEQWKRQYLPEADPV